MKKEKVIMLVFIFVLVLAIIGVSYAAFNYARTGTKINTITTGEISMSYEEGSNVINLNGALPTTDKTGVVRLNEREYFDFTVTTNIKGNSYINWEIAAEDVTVSDRKIDGENIKLYLTTILDDGTEISVMDAGGAEVYDGEVYVYGVIPTYKEEIMANNVTGRPSGMMSLTTGTTSTQGKKTVKYRLRMFVSEDYNPQGDGGGLSFSVKINVYGKNEAANGALLKEYMDYYTDYYFYDFPETDFHTNEYRDKITSIVTKGDTIIPETAVESWDLSSAADGSVIGYVEDDGTGTGYKLTLGANGKIVANPNMLAYFSGFTNVSTMDLSYLDTSLVTNMMNIFLDCSSLTQVLVSVNKWVTSQASTNNMFYGCQISSATYI